LLDNKAPQPILSFQAVNGANAASGPPVNVILVIDGVNAGFNTVARARDQIALYLKRNGGELPRPVTLVVLTDSGAQIGNSSTRDGNALAQDLNSQKLGLRTITRSQGFYGAGDRMQLSLRALEQLAAFEATRPGRKLVIWISPGWPLLSGPGVELTAKTRQQIFHSIVSVSDSLRRADITLYSIDPLGMADAGGVRTTYYENFVKGVRNPNQVDIGDLGLQVLAVQSGGRALNSSNDVAGLIADCVADAGAWYVLSFERAVGDGPDEYHAIVVKTDNPHVSVRTRTGYYAQPEHAPGS